METRAVDTSVFRHSEVNHFAGAYKEACMRAAFSGKYIGFGGANDKYWYIVYPDWSTVEIMRRGEMDDVYENDA